MTEVENKEKLKEQRRKYASQPHVKAKLKKYQQKNKEKINEQRWEAAQKKKLLNKNPHNFFF